MEVNCKSNFSLSFKTQGRIPFSYMYGKEILPCVLNDRERCLSKLSISLTFVYQVSQP